MREMDMMGEFHLRFDFKQEQLSQIPVNHDTKIMDMRLRTIGKHLEDLAIQHLPEALDMQTKGDTRLYRAHLILEELGELLIGMGERNEVMTADAIADLGYVVIGSAYTMDLPFHELFAEVHRSNMTKQRNDGNERMRVKGPLYSPPRIAEAVAAGRAMAKIPVTEEIVSFEDLERQVRNETDPVRRAELKHQLFRRYYGGVFSFKSAVRTGRQQAQIPNESNVAKKGISRHGNS